MPWFSNLSSQKMSSSLFFSPFSYVRSTFMSRVSSAVSRAVTAVRSQSQCAVVVQLLMTSPSCRVAHPFHFNLCFEFQALPFSSLRQHELCLSNFAGERISRVEAAALQLLPILAFDCHAQHTGNSGNAVIGEANDQSLISIVFIAPDKRGPQ